MATDYLHVESLDIDAQGIARREDGKVVFIEGALPTEWVSVVVGKRKNHWEQGNVTEWLRTSSQRVLPLCDHFGLHAGACGGCKMQHLHTGAQIAVKQRVLEDNLWHLAKVKPEHILRPVQGPDWGYRYRARLSVRYVEKKAKVLIGFHERKSRYVTDMTDCRVLPDSVRKLLQPLSDLISALQVRDSCPQIEVACTQDKVALVLRHLKVLTQQDLNRLREFAHTHSVEWWLQSAGPETVRPITGANFDPDQSLYYTLPEFDIKIYFKPTHFTQVNPFINRSLVVNALQLLDLNADDRIIDWFCGLGNFTLPIATKAKEVLGVEGNQNLVDWANNNWHWNQQQRQHILHAASLVPTRFLVDNLFDITSRKLTDLGIFDKWLIDPPREGAFALVKALADSQQGMLSEESCSWEMPKKIVYVSCNPATLARDAGILVHLAGYRCTQVGIVNMFPHTAHVESIAVFEK